MIIVGNSNVDVFRQCGLRFSSKTEKIAVNWVGAIKIGQFLKFHPAGTKVRNILDRETGWKLLCIGGHDIFELCTYASLGNVVDHFEEAFKTTINSYADVFKELNKSGRFGWIVFPQPIHLVQLRNFTATDALNITKRFNKRIEELCLELGVLVINPLDKMRGYNGEVLKEFLQHDGSHLNINGAKTYIEEIEILTDEKLFFRSDVCICEAASEVESFCTLFMGELDIPKNVKEASHDVCKIIVEFVSKNLKDRGITNKIDPQTKLLTEGLVDKDFHTIICDFAAEIMLTSFPLDISLNDLDSIGDIVDQLLHGERYHNRTAETTILSQKDFLTSLLGNFEDPAQREAILKADEKISNACDDIFSQMQNIAPPDSREVLANYGIISFWYSLIFARNGNYIDALRFIDQSKKPGGFPFISSRAGLYITEWKNKINEHINTGANEAIASKAIYDTATRLSATNLIDLEKTNDIKHFDERKNEIKLPALSAASETVMKNFYSNAISGVTDPEKFAYHMSEAAKLVTPGYYFGDNLFTWGKNNSLFEDSAFVESWQRNTLNSSDQALAWRRYFLACAACHCIQLPGDFVECGVREGTSMKMIIDYISPGQFKKTFWGYDTFADSQAGGGHVKGQTEGFYEVVNKRFEGYSRVKLVRGLLPGSLNQNAPEAISFLHLDLNSAEGEIAVLDRLFDRIVAGGIIVLETYESLAGSRRQKISEDSWFESRNYRVFPLPTGQGFVLKR